MGYYGRSLYRGDYRGPLALRGDFLDDIGGFAGKLGGIVDKASQYVPLVGGMVKGYNAAFGKSIAAPTIPSHPALSAPGSTTPNLPPMKIQMVQQKGFRGGTKFTQATENRNDGGGYRRRMNACNPKALRRAMRRTAAFMGFAKKYVKLVNPKAHVEMRHHPIKKHHKK